MKKSNLDYKSILDIICMIEKTDHAAAEKAAAALQNFDLYIRDLEAENKKMHDELHPALTWNLPKWYTTAGTRKGAIEIYFDGMPGTGYLEALKSYKFRWNGNKKCWYGFASEAEIREILTDYNAA